MATRFFTEEWRVWGIFPRKRFVCDMDVMDAGAFGVIFSTATSNFKEWYGKNHRSAREFELRLSSNPLLLERAMRAVRDLHNADEGYEFIKKIKLKLVFKNQETGKVEHYEFDD